MTALTHSRARELAELFADRRIVVLGDLMLDEFVWGKVRRISPEAPVPVVEIERTSNAIGGAGNVASNLLALGANPILIGTVGDDLDAGRLREVLSKSSLDVGGLIVDRSRPTTLKTRIIAHNQQVVRTDRENRTPISPEIEEAVVARFRTIVDEADAVVVSDYSKGLLTPRVLSAILSDSRSGRRIVCLDPKRRNFDLYQPVTVITPNSQEAADASGIAVEDETGLKEAGSRILASIDCEAVLVTRGEEGMTLFTREGEVSHIPTVAREVYDVTGAGDTVVATLALALAAGASLRESAELANHAAGVVVGKLGTATVTRVELTEAIEEKAGNQ